MIYFLLEIEQSIDTGTDVNSYMETYDSSSVKNEIYVLDDQI